MGEPEKKRDQGDAVGPGLILAIVLFMAAFIALMIFVRDNPGHWLSLLKRVCSFLVGCYVFLWMVPKGIIRSFRRRAEERRYRAERDEGLNGPSNHR